jgi:DNA repair protein RAD50
MKYIMAGILPPSCERGKNFLIDPRIIGQSEVKGEIRLKFRSYNGRPVMAVRRSLFSLNNRGSKFEST